MLGKRSAPVRPATAWACSRRAQVARICGRSASAVVTRSVSLGSSKLRHQRSTRAASPLREKASGSSVRVSTGSGLGEQAAASTTSTASAGLRTRRKRCGRWDARARGCARPRITCGMGYPVRIAAARRVSRPPPCEGPERHVDAGLPAILPLTRRNCQHDGYGCNQWRRREPRQTPAVSAPRRKPAQSPTSQNPSARMCTQFRPDSLAR